jgi:hypothetical protein
VIKEKYPSAVSIEHAIPCPILNDLPRLRVFFFNKEEADWFEKDCLAQTSTDPNWMSRIYNNCYYIVEFFKEDIEEIVKFYHGNSEPIFPMRLPILNEKKRLYRKVEELKRENNCYKKQIDCLKMRLENVQKK